MIKLVEIENNLKITVSDAIPGMNFFAACGRNQPPRNYVSSWIFENKNDDEIHIYISEELDSTNILKRLAPFLEGIDNVFNLEEKLPKFL